MLALTRILSLLLLVAVAAFFVWFTLRGDTRLTSVSFLPRGPMVYFDLYPLARNFPAFGVLGMLLAASVIGLSPKWQVLSLVLCLSAPVLKDIAQIPLEGRHFNWFAVGFGLLGAAVGWAVCWAVGHWIIDQIEHA
jgi:hypothetical protein